MIDVTVEYMMKENRINALDNVTLSVESGEFLSVIGPSGSGKSTLLQVLGGMLSPLKGEVFVDGNSLYDLKINKRAVFRRMSIGFVFQTFNLIPYLSAQQNVQVPMMLNNIPPSEQFKRSAVLLEKVGLGDRTTHKPAQLSAGQQQRVALARTLANDPRIILADEPTGALDPETGNQILSILKDLNREGRTVIMVTHDPKAAGMASRCIRLIDGAIESGILGESQASENIDDQPPIPIQMVKTM
ncbi:MAG: ABC transporter ATP-binding protein [Desulfobacteraceae bacterium]|nr:ABC transporter ATP-binding protein [Desulfobacteraceae bacterium]